MGGELLLNAFATMLAVLSGTKASPSSYELCFVDRHTCLSEPLGASNPKRMLGPPFQALTLPIHDMKRHCSSLGQKDHLFLIRRGGRAAKQEMIRGPCSFLALGSSNLDEHVHDAQRSIAIAFGA